MKEKIEILERNIRDLFIWMAGYVAALKDENSHDFITQCREETIELIEELKNESRES